MTRHRRRSDPADPRQIEISANSRRRTRAEVLERSTRGCRARGVPSLARLLGGPNDLLSRARASTDAALVPTDRPPARVASLREGTPARGAPRVSEACGSDVRTIELRARRQSWRQAAPGAAAGARA